MRASAKTLLKGIVPTTAQNHIGDTNNRHKNVGLWACAFWLKSRVSEAHGRDPMAGIPLAASGILVPPIRASTWTMSLTGDYPPLRWQRGFFQRGTKRPSPDPCHPCHAATSSQTLLPGSMPVGERRAALMPCRLRFGGQSVPSLPVAAPRPPCRCQSRGSSVGAGPWPPVLP